MAEDFEKLGFRIRRGGIVSHVMAPRLHDRRFREMFGCSSIVCANAWMLILEGFNHDMPSSATKVRFLRALNLLKAYDTKGNASTNVGEGCDEKTFRYWAWWFIETLSERSVEIVRLLFLVIFFHLSRHEITSYTILVPVFFLSFPFLTFRFIHKPRSISKIAR